ncbi:UDP-N-acetylglucosamine 1-carboxyvinyltransferase [candidate division WWE3 bacterium CG08_land_8_20_14_0_20_41_15]|uniref:UDP-N-acetylglucosamine 1-carboxyvinyltransferase n=1 Tax=candidate division WWE3 bacterium CG08_land_8_20_14_0_20_41_15 TaxID=1975086 RepID=A0A2H0X9N5_UNCKA|nr:MAG: UDP-N-acetylglucosamine 1-carboxyvinyltransferase [candidate division WWE3 bacterium CG08_land_8_20_14_0_20_41_15]
MSFFQIEGGNPLKGKVKLSGAKNAAIKMIVASLLTDEDVILEDVPEISDVEVDIEILRSLGVEALYIRPNVLKLSSKKIHSYEVFKELSSKSRASILLLGPLLYRFGKAKIYELGGCKIGSRPLDRHINALKTLGARIDYSGGAYTAESSGRLVGASVVFEKVTVMGTENVILSSVLGIGKTRIIGAALEPEVDDLILLLTKMGAKIARSLDGAGRNTIEVEGVDNLKGATHSIIPDRNEAVTFALAGSVTQGDIVIENARPKDLIAFLAKIQQAGVDYEVSENSLRVWREEGTKLKSLDLVTAPHPGFMTDWQQPFSVLLCLAEGVSTIHETVYSDRFEYTKELNRMGAKISLYHPVAAPSVYSFSDYTEEGLYAASISGPTDLRGRRLTVVDLRAGATLVLAALSAKGKSEVYGVELIDRGYERFEEKLKGLGAFIERKS